MDHQFGGNRCAQAQMFGAFLPLNLCPKKDAADKLTTLIDKYDLAYHHTTLDKEWEKAIPDFGALDLPIQKPHPNDDVRFDHALLKITDTDHGISFLRKNGFRYVTGIGGMSFAEYSKHAKGLGLTTFPNRTERWLDATPPNDEMVAAWQALQIKCEQDRHIAASVPAEWKDSADFAHWLSRGPNYEVDPKDVVVALVYENYD